MECARAVMLVEEIGWWMMCGVQVREERRGVRGMGGEKRERRRRTGTGREVWAGRGGRCGIGWKEQGEVGHRGCLRKRGNAGVIGLGGLIKSCSWKL